jgi:hypothetical protein
MTKGFLPGLGLQFQSFQPTEERFRIRSCSACCSAVKVRSLSGTYGPVATESEGATRSGVASIEESTSATKASDVMVLRSISFYCGGTRWKGREEVKGGAVGCWRLED